MSSQIMVETFNNTIHVENIHASVQHTQRVPGLSLTYSGIAICITRNLPVRTTQKVLN